MGCTPYLAAAGTELFRKVFIKLTGFPSNDPHILLSAISLSDHIIPFLRLLAFLTILKISSK
jgi:hypothetical protein